jgi:hypothetical protein
MATEFAVPSPMAQDNPTLNQYTLYGTQSQPISPVNSATATPQNSSPTSPLSGAPYPLPLGLQARQLRPLKSPLYVPAVLRPTDPPRRLQRPSSITPPHSANSTFDTLSSLKPLSRKSTADSGKYSLGKISEFEWSISGLPEVTNLPTRKHWKVC